MSRQTFEVFEDEWASWNGVDNVVACSTGTDALHLALEALQLPPGSGVLVPDFTMVACARAVTLAGLRPVFVDCNEDLLITKDTIIKAVLNSDWDCVAVMPVHIYGRQCDMESITQLAKELDLKVIEDLAEAHGVRPHPETDAACWSFYRNKVIAGEEGGAIAFKQVKHADLARLLRCQGFTPMHDFTHIPRGINARLSNVHAHLILKDMEQYPNNLQIRRKLEQTYNEIIDSKYHMPPRLVPWVYDIRLPGYNIDHIVKEFNEVGIAARHGFKRLSRQTEYKSKETMVLTTGPPFFSSSHKAEKEIMYLPIAPYMEPADAETIGLALFDLL